MSNQTKAMRSKTAKEAPSATQSAAVSAIRKVFYISESLLADNKGHLHLEHFYHHGKGRAVLFVTSTMSRNVLMEVIQFAEPRRSWLINSDVCSNGRIYLTTPIDATFLALHHIRKHCTNKALALDSIHDEKDASVNRLLTHFVCPEQLRYVADMKTSGEMTFFKYNAERTLAWLAVKTHHVVKSLKAANVHCGHSALSQNYQRSEKTFEEQGVNEMDYLRMACDIVGSYLDAELHEDLISYLQIPNEIQALNEDKANAQKRKSQQNLKANDIKKIKLEDNGTNGTASAKLKNSSLLDTSTEDRSLSLLDSSLSKPTPLKERILTAKEKALAKSAKGTKSIMAFFKK